MCVLTYAHRLRALTPRHLHKRRPADLPATT